MVNDWCPAEWWPAVTGWIGQTRLGRTRCGALQCPPRWPGGARQCRIHDLPCACHRAPPRDMLDFNSDSRFCRLGRARCPESRPNASSSPLHSWAARGLGLEFGAVRGVRGGGVPSGVRRGAPSDRASPAQWRLTLLCPLQPSESSAILAATNAGLGTVPSYSLDRQRHHRPPLLSSPWRSITSRFDLLLC
jgi:hypothetical protein